MINTTLPKAVLLILLTFWGYTGSSQAPIETSVIRLSGRLNINHAIVYTSDTALLNIDSIDRKAPEAWHFSRTNSGINMGISNRLYWFRFQLYNASGTDEQFYLLNSNRGINEMELFQKKGKQIVSLGLTGDHYPYNQRPYRSGNFIYPIPIGAGDTATFYLYCNKKNENLNFNLYLITEDQLHLRENNTQLFMGLFCGILLLGVIVSLFLFFIFKEKLPFWYSIYILVVINRLLAFEGIDFQFFYPNYPLYADMSRYIASSLLLALLTYIMQLYCNQQASNSRFYLATNILRWSTILFIPFTIIIYQYYPFYLLKRIHFILFMIEQTGGVVLLAISCFEKIQQRFKPAGFYFAAVVILLFSGILAILQEIGMVNYSSETPNLIQWSFVFEVIVIIIGILYRYNLIKQENDLLYNDLNEQKLNSIKQILHIQQKEQKRIAEDLHDILGAQLAVIKMKINTLAGVNDQKETVSHLIDEVVENTRNIAHNLVPLQLHDNAISDIIAAYVLQLNSAQPIRFQFVQTGSPTSFKKEVELDLYKILMEIIQNILKHSGATEASIQFFFNDQGFEIIAEDNGKGISPEMQKGMGFNNILKRVKNLNGKIHIDAAAGNTTFIIIIPVKND